MQECRERGDAGECVGIYDRNAVGRGEYWRTFGNLGRSGNDTGPPWDSLADKPVSEKFNSKSFHFFLSLHERHGVIV